MWTGKRFTLRAPTLAVDNVSEKPQAVTIPAGTTVRVVSGPRNGDRLVDVVWEERALTMFTIDLKQRGDETTAISSKQT